MRIIFVISILSFLFLSSSMAQGSAFGVKGGPSLGFQKWGNQDSEILLRYHVIAYIESYNYETPNSLFAQIGYHIRGGASRIRGRSYQEFNGSRLIEVPTTSFPYEFRNIALSLGVKQRFEFGNLWGYYLLGARGEYTINTNLAMYHQEDDPLRNFNLRHPFEGGTRNWQYGIIAGGGIEFMFSELIGGLIELSISPDFSLQYFQQPFTYNSYINGSQTAVTVQEREIRNISVELTFGIRLLRIIEYVDSVF